MKSCYGMTVSIAENKYALNHQVTGFNFRTDQNIGASAIKV